VDDFSDLLNHYLGIGLVPNDDSETPMVIRSMKYVRPNQTYIVKEGLRLHIKSFV